MNHSNDNPTTTRRYVKHQRNNQVNKTAKKSKKSNQKIKINQNDQSQNKSNQDIQSNKIKNSQNNQPARDSNQDQAQAPQLSLATPSPFMAEPQISEPGISERRGIKWVRSMALQHTQALTSLQIPGELEEPTSTLVLTSSKKQFIDVRITCKAGHSLPNEGQYSSLSAVLSDLLDS